MKRLLVAGGLLAALSLFGTEAFAQYGTARGRVVDDKNAPLADANVLIEYTGGVTKKLEIKTTKKGEYTQVGLASGMYRITATKPGYVGSYVEYKIQLGEATQVPDLKLVPEAVAKAATVDKAAEEMRASFEKADALIKAGKTDEAEVALKEILVKNPAVPEVHHELARLAMQKKDWATAEKELNEALKLRPDYADAKFALADVFQKTGQTQKATELLSAGDSAQDPATLFNLGVVHLNAARHADALAAFEKVVAVDPTNAEAYFHMGSVLMNLGRTSDAVAAYEKYIALNPKNPTNVALAQSLVGALKPKK
jgi:Flp pilus assembly protein TadD